MNGHCVEETNKEGMFRSLFHEATYLAYVCYTAQQMHGSDQLKYMLDNVTQEIASFEHWIHLFYAISNCQQENVSMMLMMAYKVQLQIVKMIRSASPLRLDEVWSTKFANPDDVAQHELLRMLKIFVTIHSSQDWTEDLEKIFSSCLCNEETEKQTISGLFKISEVIVALRSRRYVDCLKLCKKIYKKFDCICLNEELLATTLIVHFPYPYQQDSIDYFDSSRLQYNFEQTERSHVEEFFALLSSRRSSIIKLPSPVVDNFVRVLNASMTPQILEDLFLAIIRSNILVVSMFFENITIERLSNLVNWDERLGSGHYAVDKVLRSQNELDVESFNKLKQMCIDLSQQRIIPVISIDDSKGILYFHPFYHCLDQLGGNEKVCSVELFSSNGPQIIDRQFQFRRDSQMSQQGDPGENIERSIEVDIYRICNNLSWISKQISEKVEDGQCKTKTD